MLQGALSFGVGFEPDIYLDGDDLRDLWREWFTQNRAAIQGLGLDDEDEVPVRLTLEVVPVKAT